MWNVSGCGAQQFVDPGEAMCGTPSRVWGAVWGARAALWHMEMARTLESKGFLMWSRAYSIGL